MEKSCPLCRNPLPPGPEKLFDLGCGMYMKIWRAVNRSRPGARPETPWPTLSGDQKREMDQAVAMLREAADQGHLEAQACCGDIYGFGRGVARDDRVAFVYAEMSAQQGRPASQFNTGLYYRDGLGCEQSFARAAEWWEKAARLGHANAMASLGLLYHDGHGVPRSYARAIEWWEKAARLGQSNATRNLGLLYKNGDGVSQSYAQAAEWFQKAARLGDTEAINNLGVLYITAKGSLRAMSGLSSCSNRVRQQGMYVGNFMRQLFTKMAKASLKTTRRPAGCTSSRRRKIPRRLPKLVHPLTNHWIALARKSSLSARSSASG